MEKENIAWLIIRALGIYIGFEAVTKFLSLFNYPLLYELQTTISAEVGAMTMFIQFGFSFLVFILYSFMSYYCLRKGAFLHKLILFKENDKKA